jgi:hypothetical protein
MITEDRPAKGTLRLRWANGDAGRVNLPSVAGVPLGRRRYGWLGPKVCLILTRIKGGWSVVELGHLGQHTTMKSWFPRERFSVGRSLSTAVNWHYFPSAGGAS